jgi:hypothetical protein
VPDRGPMVAGQSAADRLMASITYHRGGRALPADVVADVLRGGLTDYTMWLAALDYRPDGPGRTGYATSACRFLHAVADDLESR